MTVPAIPGDRQTIEAFLEMMAAEAGAARNTLLAYRRDLEGASALLGGGLDNAFTWLLAECTRRGYQLLYATAWEMFLAVEAAPHSAFVRVVVVSSRLIRDLFSAVIETMGGAEFCSINLNRTKGGNEAGVAKLKENDAFDHYCHQFSNPECIAGSCADYAAGATTDLEAQEADQKAGRKVEIPTLVLFSAERLGRMHDVPGLWEGWVSGELRTFGVEGGYGHYLPEECPEIVAERVREWVGHVGK